MPEEGIEIKIIKDPALFQEGRKLLYRELGGFFTEKNIASKAVPIMLEARREGQLLGATFAYKDRERARLFLEKTELSLDPDLALYAAGLAVKGEWRRQGIGGLLLRSREREGRRMGLQYLLGDSWLESPSPSRHLLEKEGMREVARLQEYWRRDEPIADYCPSCGDICYCTAILFYKDITKD